MATQQTYLDLHHTREEENVLLMFVLLCLCVVLLASSLQLIKSID